MKYILYIASYFPFLAMVLFYIATITLVFVSLLNDLVKLEFSIVELAIRVYEPFAIAVIALAVIIPLSVLIYYFNDIRRNDSIEEDEKKIWRSFLLKATMLGSMFYYDQKYKDSIFDYVGMTLFRDSRNKLIEYFDIAIPSSVKDEIDMKGSHKRHDLSFYFFLVGIVTIVLSVVVSIL